LSFLGFTVVEVRTHILSGLTASTTNSTFNYERDIASKFLGKATFPACGNRSVTPSMFHLCFINAMCVSESDERPSASQ